MNAEDQARAGRFNLAQTMRLEPQMRTRDDNAAYLTTLLREISGITPAKQYTGCTRNAYHIYLMRYDKERFAGLPRAAFMKALRAEGIPVAGGYSPLNKQPFLARGFGSRAYQRIYSKQQLAALQERNQCPQNDRLCEEALWFGQTMLLGTKRDMDQIAEAIRQIQAHAGRIQKTERKDRGPHMRVMRCALRYFRSSQRFGSLWLVTRIRE